VKENNESKFQSEAN